MEAAWAAGFFDGEGHTAVWSSHKGAYSYLRLQVSQTGDRSVLERFMSALGVGRIYGPYTRKNRPTQNPYCLFMAHNGDAHVGLDVMWPYLGEVKRAQATAALAKLSERNR